MKRTLSFMVMALALLLTQCRKPEVKFPSPVAPEGTTVSMTVTAGPGSKTDITTAGAIKWSEGDKLYVGFDGKYVGFLTLVGDGGSATGTFTGSVTLPNGTTGENEFGFFYLGSDNSVAPHVGDATVVVSFATQEIYANGTNLSDDAKKFHVGYGSASGTVKDGVVTGINVTLVSKVALAHFSFKKGGNGYSNALTLSGDKIYSSMTVGFDGTFVGTSGSTTSGISLTGSHSERYVMLVPVGTGSETLSFAGDGFEGSTTLGSGIEPNKFYGREVAIEVKHVEFTVAAGTTVEFSPGNLYWDGSAFRFEANQWDFRHYNGKTGDAAVIGGESTITPAGTVGSFFWSKTASVAYASSYSDSGASTSDVFFTNATQTTANPDFTVNGETGTWRTLSKAEWDYLLNTRTNASSLRAWKDLGNNVKGLVILPDGTENPSTVLDKITSTEALATHGAVFLPAAGLRFFTDVYNVGSLGYFYSSTPYEDLKGYAYYMYFDSGGVYTGFGTRNRGYAVRLVR